MSDEGRLIAGRYLILDRIGRGGMATVWRAHDELLGRQVAVKKLHSQPQLDDAELATLFERARREAQSAARISHPNVVVVHDVVDDEGRPTIVMEYVRSTTLADRIKAYGTVPLDEVARIGRGVIAALRAAHRAGVLHRDVKPANVLLAEDGRVVLTDFGIAQAVETSALTRTGQLVGSVDFMAPERLVGAKPGPEADLWALGATLFEAVEGRSPFLRETVAQTMYAIAMEPAPEVRGAGPLTPLIQGLLVAKPADRLSAEDAERMLRRPAGAAGPSVVPPAAHPVAVADDAPAPAATPVPPSPSPSPSPSGLNSDRGTDDASAAEPPVVPPQPDTTDQKAHRPPGRSKKPVVLAAAVATALLITIAVLLTNLPTGKSSATASDGPRAADNPTQQSTDTSTPTVSSPQGVPLREFRLQVSDATHLFEADVHNRAGGLRAGVRRQCRIRGKRIRCHGRPGRRPCPGGPRLAEVPGRRRRDRGNPAGPCRLRRLRGTALADRIGGHLPLLGELHDRGRRSERRPDRDPTERVQRRLQPAIPLLRYGTGGRSVTEMRHRFRGHERHGSGPVGMQRLGQPDVDPQIIWPTWHFGMAVRGWRERMSPQDSGLTLGGERRISGRGGGLGVVHIGRGTVTSRSRPSVSVRMWRLRPSRDLPPSYPRLSPPTVSEASTD